MLKDKYHEHYLIPENHGEFEELFQYVKLYTENSDTCCSMYSNVKRCIEKLGFGKFSLYSNENMIRGEGVDEFLKGFWLKVNKADKKNKEPINFYHANIIEENDFWFIQTIIIPEDINDNDKDKSTEEEIPVLLPKYKSKKEKINLDIFNIKNYNGVEISFSESRGFSSAEYFEYTIVLSCYNGDEYEDDFDYDDVDGCNKGYKYILQIYSDDQLYDEVGFKKYEKNINIDYSFFDNIFNRLKDVNFKAFLYENVEIMDAGGISFTIRKNKISFNLFYYDDENDYRKSAHYSVIELNKILNLIKKKINFDEWYSGIQKEVFGSKD